MHEDQIDRRIAEAEAQARGVLQRHAEAAERAEDRCHRQQHRLERDEAGKQHQPEHQRVAGKAPFGQHIAIQRPHDGGDRHSRHDHLDRVPEVTLDAGAGEPHAGLAPGLDPGIEGRRLRQRQHVAVLDLVHRLERGREHDEERHQIEDGKDQQQAVDDDTADPAGVGAVLRPAGCR
ncbi:hypothetical protein ACVIRO_002235 [Rhizobium ruizarguesonis]